MWTDPWPPSSHEIVSSPIRGVSMHWADCEEEHYGYSQTDVEQQLQWSGVLQQQVQVQFNNISIATVEV